MLRLEKEITALKDRKLFNSITIQIPKYGTVCTIDPSKLSILPSVTSNGSTKVARLWQRFVHLIEAFNLSEETAKDCFATKLNDEPADIFELYSDKPLVEIIDHMVKQFDSPPNRSSYLQEIKNFTRKENESITQAMTRLKSLLQGAEQFKNIMEESSNEQIILRQNLEKTVNSKTWEKATEVEFNCRRQGIQFSIENLITEIVTIEQRNCVKNISHFPVKVNTYDIHKNETK